MDDFKQKLRAEFKLPFKSDGPAVYDCNGYLIALIDAGVIPREDETKHAALLAETLNNNDVR